MRVDKDVIVAGMAVGMMEVAKMELVNAGKITEEDFDKAVIDSKRMIMDTYGHLPQAEAFERVTAEYNINIEVEEDTKEPCELCDKMTEMEVEGECPLCGADIEIEDVYEDDDIELTETGTETKETTNENLPEGIPEGFKFVGKNALGMKVYEGPRGEFALSM